MKANRKLTEAMLLLEQTVESGASICSVAGSRDRTVMGHRGMGDGTGWQSITGYSYARHEKLTRVRLILEDDTQGDRFQTLKTSGRIEMNTLLTTVKSGSASATNTFEIGVGAER